MQILSKRAGIYGAAGGRSGGTWEDRQMNIFASKNFFSFRFIIK